MKLAPSIILQRNLRLLGSAQMLKNSKSCKYCGWRHDREILCFVKTQYVNTFPTMSAPHFFFSQCPHQQLAFLFQGHSLDTIAVTPCDKKKWFIASDRCFIHPGIYPSSPALVAKFANATIYVVCFTFILHSINKARYSIISTFLNPAVHLSGCIHQAFWTDFTFWRFAKPCRIL